MADFQTYKQRCCQIDQPHHITCLPTISQGYMYERTLLSLHFTSASHILSPSQHLTLTAPDTPDRTQATTLQPTRRKSHIQTQSQGCPYLHIRRYSIHPPPSTKSHTTLTSPPARLRPRLPNPFRPRHDLRRPLRRPRIFSTGSRRSSTEKSFRAGGALSPSCLR